jgi:16S rRNA (guanine527-N7)-methyltransferase
MSVGQPTQADLGGVSRETLEDLRRFAGLVEKWNPAVNLVSRKALTELWERHILDSMQVFRIAEDAGLSGDRWCDLGSGGGFPGLVVAIQAKHALPAMKVALVESDQRKAVFLRETARQLELNVTVVNQRIEEAPPAEADVVSARGLASLDVLCGHSLRHLRPGGAAIFLKGATAEAEIAEARAAWRFNLTTVRSQGDASAKILVLKDIQRV